MENDNTKNEGSINPIDFIKQASQNRADKIQAEIIQKQMLEQQQIIDNKINRQLREQLNESKKIKKIKTIEDVLKKGDKIRWEIINEGNLKGFVKNRLVFEIKRGMTIFNLYIKDVSLLKEGSKSGYVSCSSNIQKIKEKSENLIK